MRRGVGEFPAGREHDRLIALGECSQNRQAAGDPIVVPEGERIVKQQRSWFQPFAEHARHREPDDQVDLRARAGGQTIELDDGVRFGHANADRERRAPKSPWILHGLGVTEEDQAALRLLLRSARKQLGQDWVWGAEADADLLLIDSRDPVDDSDIGRATRRTVASALILDADAPAEEGPILRRPFNKDAFMALLEEVRYDQRWGSPINNNLADYLVSTNADHADHEVVFLD